ncbi:hypothetical protein B0H13DRAFT_2286257 [Mycena leptocephala]|nr:hypothetical protein B0H13DRAFT_2286257 [Mycena leptocephala]
MNVLVPVKDALQTLLKPLLERKDMAEPRYFFNIRQQQYSPTKDSTRSDHFLVFEHRDGIDPEDKVTAPNKRVIWQSPKEFANMLQARVAWEVSNPNATAADRKKAPPYPRLVLGVIEEKKPDVVQESEFSHDYANQNSQGAKNVNAFLPQLKKYSIDAQCRLVILTDYLTTLLLDVQKAGARWDPIEETIKPIPGEVARVAVCRLDQKPRYALFSIAVRRLIDAGLITISLREDDKGKADLKC